MHVPYHFANSADKAALFGAGAFLTVFLTVTDFFTGAVFLTAFGLGLGGAATGSGFGFFSRVNERRFLRGTPFFSAAGSGGGGSTTVGEARAPTGGAGDDEPPDESRPLDACAVEASDCGFM